MKKVHLPQRWRGYLPLFVVIGIVLVIAIGVIVGIVCRTVGGDPRIIAQAIARTEEQDNVFAEVSSEVTVTVDNASQTITTDGYIYREDDAASTAVYVRTASEDNVDPTGDFDVTALLYTDGAAVYDNTSGKPTVTDMTVEEFEDIVDQYRLYSFRSRDAVSIRYTESEVIEQEGGEYTVVLECPSDDVLTAYAAAIAQITDEEVKADDLTVISALAVYGIYDDLVVSQTCRFEVEYTCDNGRNVRYAGTTAVAFYHDFDLNEIEAAMANIQNGEA